MLQSGTYPTTGGGLLLFKLLLIIVALINGTYLYMNYQTLALLEGDTQNLIPLLGMQAYGILAPVVLVLLMPANRKKAALAKARTARIEPNIEL